MVNKKRRINSAKTVMGKVVTGVNSVVADFSLRLERELKFAKTIISNSSRTKQRTSRLQSVLYLVFRLWYIGQVSQSRISKSLTNPDFVKTF